MIHGLPGGGSLPAQTAAIGPGLPGRGPEPPERLPGRAAQAVQQPQFNADIHFRHVRASTFSSPCVC